MGLVRNCDWPELLDQSNFHLIVMMYTRERLTPYLARHRTSRFLLRRLGRVVDHLEILASQVVVPLAREIRHRQIHRYPPRELLHVPL